ncbi:MAG: type VI secretion system contractile sheath small subunit [bacterium]|nr:type VI secretion system contractile sheath small subunit [bacterium]
MKAAIIFSGSSPILIITTYENLLDENITARLHDKGLKRYILSEVPVEKCRALYGNHFDLVVESMNPDGDMRVLDFDGSRIFVNFTFKDMGEFIRVGD